MKGVRASRLSFETYGNGNHPIRNPSEGKPQDQLREKAIDLGYRTFRKPKPVKR